MKRIRTVMLPIAVMAFLTACGGKPDVTSGSDLKQGIKAVEEAITIERNVPAVTEFTEGMDRDRERYPHGKGMSD